MKKLIFCLFFMVANTYTVMYHDVLEAIKASNPEQLQKLILAIQLLPAEKKSLLDFAKQTVNKRQRKIDNVIQLR